MRAPLRMEMGKVQANESLKKGTAIPVTGRGGP
jgi:hypothetical protein